MSQMKEKVLRINIILNFAGGKMTSLVGHSGSGKSTILKFNTQNL